MSAAKFTPGPWTIRETPESDYTDFAIHIGPDYIGVYKESDAHLIAAAPDLYEALTWAIQIHDDLERMGIVHYDPNLPDAIRNIAKARAALKKARGEA